MILIPLNKARRVHSSPGLGKTRALITLRASDTDECNGVSSRAVIEVALSRSGKFS